MKKIQCKTNSVLIIDDEKTIQESFRDLLKSKGIDSIICCQDSRNAMEILEKNKIDTILLDLCMPHVSGEELIPIIKQEYPKLPIIIVTGINEVSIAVECMHKGAFDYLVKPIENSKLFETVCKALETQNYKKRCFSNELKNPEAFSEIITNNAKMKSLFLYIESISKTTLPVLITGETGVGKELIARAIHTLSCRKGEYVCVNVAGLDDNMFSDTLFGHHKGAFSGALEMRKGLIEKASNGTLFLDEIGDLSMASQIKLLRFLETNEYFALGSDAVKKAKTRTIVASNRNLDKLSDEGKFRRDLYYRLSTHKVEVPPLRYRMDDLPLLINFFFKEAEREMGKQQPAPSKELYKLLTTYNFPGNIRELRSIIFDVLSRQKVEELSIKAFETAINRKNPQISKKIEESPIVFIDRFPTLKETTEFAIKEALKRAKNQALAAQLLGITPAALSKRLLRARNRHKESSN